MSDARDQVVKLVSDAAKTLMQAHTIAVQRNALAAEVPLVQELAKLSNRLAEIMPGLAKLRGL